MFPVITLITVSNIELTNLPIFLQKYLWPNVLENTKNSNYQFRGQNLAGHVCNSHSVGLRHKYYVLLGGCYITILSSMTVSKNKCSYKQNTISGYLL